MIESINSIVSIVNGFIGNNLDDLVGIMKKSFSRFIGQLKIENILKVLDLLLQMASKDVHFTECIVRKLRFMNFYLKLNNLQQPQ